MLTQRNARASPGPPRARVAAHRAPPPVSACSPPFSAPARGASRIASQFTPRIAPRLAPRFAPRVASRFAPRVTPRMASRTASRCAPRTAPAASPRPLRPRLAFVPAFARRLRRRRLPHCRHPAVALPPRRRGVAAGSTSHCHRLAAASLPLSRDISAAAPHTAVLRRRRLVPARRRRRHHLVGAQRPLRSRIVRAPAPSTPPLAALRRPHTRPALALQRRSRRLATAPRLRCSRFAVPPRPRSPGGQGPRSAVGPPMRAAAPPRRRATAVAPVRPSRPPHCRAVAASPPPRPHRLAGVRGCSLAVASPARASPPPRRRGAPRGGPTPSASRTRAAAPPQHHAATPSSPPRHRAAPAPSPRRRAASSAPRPLYRRAAAAAPSFGRDLGERLGTALASRLVPPDLDSRACDPRSHDSRSRDPRFPGSRPRDPRGHTQPHHHAVTRGHTAPCLGPRDNLGARPWLLPWPLATSAALPRPPGQPWRPALACATTSSVHCATHRCLAPARASSVPSRIAPRQRKPRRDFSTVLSPRRSTPHWRPWRLTPRPLAPADAIARPVTATYRAMRANAPTARPPTWSLTSKTPSPSTPDPNQAV